MPQDAHEDHGPGSEIGMEFAEEQVGWVLGWVLRSVVTDDKVV